MPMMPANNRRLRLTAMVSIMILVLTSTFYHQENNAHYQYCLGTVQHKLPERASVEGDKDTSLKLTCP